MTAPFFWEGNVSLINEDYHSIKGREGEKGVMIFIIKSKINTLLHMT